MTADTTSAAAGYRAYPLTATDPYMPVRRSFVRLVVPRLSGSAVKVYLHMLDDSYERVPVHDQLQWAFVTKPFAERQVAEAMGMARNSASSAIDELLGWNLIARVSPGTKTEAATYRVRLDVEVRAHPDGRVEVATCTADSDSEETADRRAPVWTGPKIEPPADNGGSKIEPLPSARGSKIEPVEAQKLSRSLNSKASEEKKESKEGARARVTRVNPDAPVVDCAAGVPRGVGSGYSQGRAVPVEPAAVLPPLPPAAYLARLPGARGYPERAGLTTAALRSAAALPADALDVPGIYRGDRGQPWAHGERYPLYVWMLSTLAAVLGNDLTDGADTRFAEPLWARAVAWVEAGRTPPQLWARFGDPEGYWWASEAQGWKQTRPKLRDLVEKWSEAGEAWQPRVQPGAAGKYAPDELDAWARVLKAAARHGRRSRVADWPELDAAERQALLALGFSDFMSRKEGDDVFWRPRYIEALRRARAEGQPAPAVREPQPVYAAV
jgi:hypothetical protein